jgi:hypothetical protein
LRTLGYFIITGIVKFERITRSSPTIKLRLSLSDLTKMVRFRACFKTELSKPSGDE